MRDSEHLMNQKEMLHTVVIFTPAKGYVVRREDMNKSKILFFTVSVMKARHQRFGEREKTYTCLSIGSIQVRPFNLFIHSIGPIEHPFIIVNG